jgi:SAM-dependent methyltransferase
MGDSTSFKDHFSSRAGDYTRYRPGYPAALFEWLSRQCSQHETAWDCGCGNGQAAIELVSYYRQVLATDLSRQQIEQALPHERINYSVATAEESGLPDASIDLIVVAQALHWFDFDRFYNEVRRVAHPDGLLAAISYGEVRVEGKAERIVSRFYHDIIGPFWPPERRYVDQGYRSLPFPFVEIVAPSFDMQVNWNLEQLIGYLGTWSAVKKYEQVKGENPLEPIAEELQKVWADQDLPRLVSWPLTLRVGRVGTRQ